MLLQEHGYFVLRFLAEDAGLQLDTIRRALSHQGVYQPLIPVGKQSNGS